MAAPLASPACRRAVAPTKTPAPRLALPTTGRHRCARAHSSVTQQAAVTCTQLGTVNVLDADNYHTFLEENAGRLSIIDYYTDWCGPCKVIAPEVEKMAGEYPDVAFAKLNAGANDASKRLAISLGIKALPTFHLYRNAKKQDEMTGAKASNLRALVDKHK